MKSQVLKCKRIKSIIEEASGYPDIGFHSRKRPFPELKKIYAKLCKTFTAATHIDIGNALGDYSHSSITHMISTFDDLLQVGHLEHGLIYESLFDFLQKEREQLAYTALSKHTPPEVAAKMHRDNLRVVVEKTNEVIRSKNERIAYLESVISDISEAFKSDDTLSKEYVFEVKAKINLIVLKNKL